MEFQFTREQEEFRAEVRAFLDEELPAGWLGVYPDAYFEDEYWDFVRAFTVKLVDKGWLTLAWPVEHGGRGLPLIHQMLYTEVMSYHRAPLREAVVGVNLVAPTVMVHGTPEQKRDILPPIASGADVYCQGFSEPGSGSDLASLQCAAVRDGDDYVVTGSKIWTSGAHRANRCILLARTDPVAPKHRGITVFVMPLDLPGVTVRPIINMMDIHYFNQVFFDEVRVPKEMIIGEENRGWYIAATTLDFERSGIGRFASGERSIDDLTAIALEIKRRGQPLAPPLRNALADVALANHVGKEIAYRVGWMQSQGLIPNQEASASKLLSSEVEQRLSQVGMQMLGLYGQVLRRSKHAALDGRIPGEYMYGLSLSIQGGTSEVQRNIMATRGLGLPRA